MDLFDHVVTSAADPVPPEGPRAPATRLISAFSLPVARLNTAAALAFDAVSQETKVLNKPQGDILKGKIRRTVCRIVDSGFTVVAIRSDDGREVTIQGFTTQTFRDGDYLEVMGEWSTYRGKPQFKAEVIKLAMPHGVAGIASWMKSGVVKGVGKAMAAKLVAAFGDDLGVALRNPDRLVGAGMKRALAMALSHAWTANGGLGEIEGKLRDFGLKPRQIVKVLERFGAAAIRVAMTNPWKFVEIEGVGFPTADAIAFRNELDMTSSARISAGLEWVLDECVNRSGHCGLPERLLVTAAVKMLDVDEEVIREEFDAFVDGIQVIRDDLTDLIYPADLLEAEIKAAENIAAIIGRSRAGRTREAADAAITRAERELGIELDRDGGQLEAAIGALTHPVVIITGGPGTGKSTTQAVIVKAHSYFGIADERVRLAAPTGRAARRLAETSGRNAQTIHRLLAYNVQTGGFVFDDENPLPLDVAIVDEFSMVDLRLFASLAAALPLDATLTIVGDVDQLASVGPGQVLRDLIESQTMPVYHLTRVHRQAAGSGIAIAAQRINKGLTPEEPGVLVRGFSVTHKHDHALLAEIVKLVRFILPEAGWDPMKDVQVIAAMRKGDVGVAALNTALKAALNPALPDGRSVSILGRDVTLDDRVMQLKNDYKKGVYNGEIGTVTGVGTDEDDDGVKKTWTTADFSGVEARYTSEDISDLDLAYAATVHKVQGCEAPVVVFAAPYAHRRMLNRNLLYTGITRGRNDCRILGDRETIRTAPEKSDVGRRHTGLKDRLKQAVDDETDLADVDVRKAVMEG